DAFRGRVQRPMEVDRFPRKLTFNEHRRIATTLFHQTSAQRDDLAIANNVFPNGLAQGQAMQIVRGFRGAKDGKYSDIKNWLATGERFPILPIHHKLGLEPRG